MTPRAHATITLSAMNYSELNLEPRLNAAVEKLNYVEMTPIQEQAIPLILAGSDVSGLAQTGTGKTAAFLVPLIEKILRTQTDPTHERAFKNWLPISQVLILVPTRELADQINENVEKISAGCGIKTYPLYGGTGYEKQKEALKSGLQFIVSTPGRLLDLYKENFVDLKQVRAIVFDEADRMFDMGFKDDMKYILGRVPRDRQFLVFSATLNFDVLNTAYQFGAEPVEINVSRDQFKAENVQDFLIHLGDRDKPQQLLSLLKKENPKQAMIFTNYKHNVDRVAKFLMDNKVPAMGISSLNSQPQRNLVIEKFKAENDQNILVATDVAARGLDIKGVDLVINYEMPQDAESYVHRIGRTGRAGREGKAFSLVSDKDIDSLKRVEEFTKKKIENSYLEDADIIKDYKHFSSGDRASYSDRFDRPKPHGIDRKKPRSFDGKPGDRRPPRQDGFKKDFHKDGPKEHAPREHSAAHAKPAHTHEKKAVHGAHAKTERHDKKPVIHGVAKPAAVAGKPHHAKPVAKTSTTVHVKKEASGSSSKSFRSNSAKSKTPAKGIGQQVKSMIKKIFG